MSYQEKKTLVTITSGAVLFVAYILLILPQYKLGENSEDLRFWASTILSFIGISIIINIVIQIAFHILFSVSIAFDETVKEVAQEKVADEKQIDRKIKLEMVEDERDKMIELKSIRVGYYFTGIGVIIALFSLVLNYSPAVMLNILFLSYLVGSLIEGLTQLYYYRKGN